MAAEPTRNPRSFITLAAVLGVVVIVAVVAFVLLLGGDEEATASSGDQNTTVRTGPAQIAFVSQSNDAYSVSVVDVDGTNLRQFPAAGAIYVPPAWSPTGEYIAFESASFGYGDIYVLDDQGTIVAQQADESVSEQYPAWSPDSAQLVYVFTVYQGDSGIAIVDIDSTDVNQIPVEGFCSFPVWSPDGEHIAFEVSQDNINEIDIMDADGSNVRPLSGEGGRFPVWSPNGDQIAFKSRVPYNDIVSYYQIFVMDADGENSTRLTNSTDSDEEPNWFVWSPDGTRIAFDAGAFGDIYVMDADGTNLSQLTDRGGSRPTWSPDGTQIAFERADDIFVLDLATGEERNLTNTPDIEESSPAWRP